MKPVRKICLFVTHLDVGGAERIAINLANGFTASHIDVDVVTRERGSNHPFSKFLNNTNIIRLNSRRPWIGPLLSIWRLSVYLRRSEPDAVISCIENIHYIAVLARWLSRRNIPVLPMIHIAFSQYWKRYIADKKIFTLQPSKWLLRSYLHLQLSRWALRSCDCIITVSKVAAEDAAVFFGISCEKIRVIYNPVVSEALLEQSFAAVPLPWQSWFSNDECPLILAIGRLAPQKDFPLLLHAFALLRKERLCRLMILGEGSERGMLESLTAELGIEKDVSFPGNVDNPYRFMRNARLLALSSDYEGLPTVMIEALACGCPVVATDCPSGPAEILESGKYGMLVPMNDVPALAQTISEVLEGKYPCTKEERIERGWEFSIDKATKKYITLIENLYA